MTLDMPVLLPLAILIIGSYSIDKYLLFLEETKIVGFLNTCAIFAQISTCCLYYYGFMYKVLHWSTIDLTVIFDSLYFFRMLRKNCFKGLKLVLLYEVMLSVLNL